MRHLAVGVAEEDDAAGDRVALRLDRHRLEVPHAHDVGLDVLGLRRVQRLPAGDLGGRVDVVERRGRADEALGAEDLFGVERPVGAAELDVPLGGKLAELGVVRHDENPPDFNVIHRRWRTGMECGRL